MSNVLTLGIDGQLISIAQDVLDVLSRKVYSFTQTDDAVWRQTVSVGTSEANLTIGLTNPGMVLAVNLDPDNFVDIGIDDSGIETLISLTPELPFALFPLKAGATIRHKADTATCMVDFRAWSR